VRTGESIELEHVTLRFGAFAAVRDVHLTVAPGEFFSFLGPSGCGKTTLLRIVSGFVEPSEGRVLIGGRDMRAIGPNKRPTALIFQNLALFPLMTVAENIAFGLEVRGVPRAARRRRALELLELIALPDAADKKVAELSGGQKQRVAIARALAVEPKVMLLDEPLSALDLKLRQHMRAELRAIQRRTGVTFVYITHDQGEALAMSDRVAVMSRGAIEQVAPAAALYDDPATPFVASFVGENNAFFGRVVAAADGGAVLETPCGRLRGRATRIAPGEEAILFVRPERLRSARAQAENLLEARVDDVSFEGNIVTLRLACAEGRPLVMSAINDGTAPPAPGSALRVGFAAADAVVLPKGELARE
jgi:spermidine/putrescine transport system ATP-binding protein